MYLLIFEDGSLQQIEAGQLSEDVMQGFQDGVIGSIVMYDGSRFFELDPESDEFQIVMVSE